MNKKELELAIKNLNHRIEKLSERFVFMGNKVDSLNETIASLNNRLYHATHTTTLREFMKSVEKEVSDKKILFIVDYEKHRFSAENCKDFEKYYGKKLLDNSIVVECKQVYRYESVEFVIDAEAKGGNNE